MILRVGDVTDNAECQLKSIAAAEAALASQWLCVRVDCKTKYALRNLVLIDHSRAFARNKMPFEKEMTRIDREFFDG